MILDKFNILLHNSTIKPVINFLKLKFNFFLSEDLGKTKLEIFEDIKKSIQYILKKQSFLLLDQEDKNGYKPYEIALANNNFFLSQDLRINSIF